jgi:hypothetical protein
MTVERPMDAPSLPVREPPPGASADLRRAAGAMLAGGIVAAVAEVAVGFAFDQIARLGGSPVYSRWFRAFLAEGGWLWVPLWGAALGGFRAAAWATTTRRCAATLAAAAVLGALPFALRPAIGPAAAAPTTPRAKSRAILKWSYRSPATVAQILELSHDPNDRVREQAILALGVNLIVTDIENASPNRPARFLEHPLRVRLRDRLLEAMRMDSVEAVRTEAARALWKSPLTFGTQPAAAETLAAVLDRALRPDAYERLTWLALDAAAGAPDERLKQAAARFAAATPDTELAAVARMAAGTP